MSVVKDVRLQERTARAKLAPRKRPYWRMVSEGCHIGYYRGKRAGSWTARYREAGSGKEYVMTTLGTADDLVDGNDDDVLNWSQALAAASEWFGHRKNGRPTVIVEPTVETVVRSYCAMRDARASAREGREFKSDGTYTLERHVLSDPIAKVKLGTLTETDLSEWASKFSDDSNSTKRRIINDFKASLNAGYIEYRRHIPVDF